MATNNYFGFTHGGTQYSAAAAAATGAAYQAGQAAGYAVAPAPAAAGYGTQRATTGYDTTYQAAATQGTYAAVGSGTTPTYEYGYGRAATTGYDASKTYYQQAAAAGQTQGYAAATGYEQAAPKTAYSTTAYAARTAAQPQAAQQTTAAKANQYTAGYQANTAGYQAATYAQPAAQTTVTAQPVTQAKQTANSSTTYSGYDAALYSAATMYVAQQSTGAAQTTNKTNNWQGYKKGSGAGGKNMRPKPPPKPQQLHYCDVCKISCAGPQTYREHLEGQKHKKREASLKLTASVNNTNQNRSGNSLRCQLCDVTCTGNDAYAAHIRGSKHQKVVMLHTKLGKPIPPTEPEVLGGSASKKSGKDADEPGTGTEEQPEPDIQPVGQDYIEEIKNDEGKVISFNCKLCECRFNDPNAKEMHMKGRRHRLQYKKKVNPDLVVDVKPSMRSRKIHEEKMRRQAMVEEYWQRRHMAAAEAEDEERLYWEERRRYEEDYLEWCRRGAMGPFPTGRGRPPFPGPPPFFAGGGGGGGGGPLRHHTESSDDRHVLARHAEIYPKEEELQAIQRIVSHTERALKLVSDQLAEAAQKVVVPPQQAAAAGAAGAAAPATAGAGTAAAAKDGAATAAGAPPAGAVAVNKDTKPDTEQKQSDVKEDGRDNQLFSFQREERDSNRVLKGVMRVGHLAKGLLLRGDNRVQLVVLCADKPTLTLLRRVVELLPPALKQVSPEHQYQVTLNAADAALTVSGDGLEVTASLTSPVMREQEAAAASSGTDRDVLARGKCLQALAALRHTKWFQARALGLHSCVVIIRILRDLCQRVPTWAPLNSWAMELLVEKVISSVGGVQLGPGDALRRLMEAVAGGILLPGGPGLADPCEKDTPDAAGAMSPQQSEDITSSAQYALRLIAYRQIYKVLGMDPLPGPPKYVRHDRTMRKRRHSDAETDSSKVTKKEAETEGVTAKTETAENSK